MKCVLLVLSAIFFLSLCEAQSVSVTPLCKHVWEIKNNDASNPVVFSTDWRPKRAKFNLTIPAGETYQAVIPGGARPSIYVELPSSNATRNITSADLASADCVTWVNLCRNTWVLTNNIAKNLTVGFSNTTGVPTTTFTAVPGINTVTWDATRSTKLGAFIFGTGLLNDVLRIAPKKNRWAKTCA